MLRRNVLKSRALRKNVKKNIKKKSVKKKSVKKKSVKKKSIEKQRIGKRDMPTENQINWAIRQLRLKAQELGRPPIKADFDDGDRARIKAFLGPWPRALEAAGLKEIKEKNIRKNRGGSTQT